MKKFMSVVFLLLLSVNAYGMSDVEKAYKERMDLLYTRASINSSHRRVLEITMKDDAEMYQLCNELNSTNRKFQMDCSVHATNKEIGESDLRKANQKRDEILDEVADMRIKLVGKFGKLPKWWKASEKAVIDQIDSSP